MAIKKKVDIVIPVYNNSCILEDSIKRQVIFFRKNLSNLAWRIVIADNASKDNTLELAKKLSRKYKEVAYFHIPEQGRGGALRYAWINTKADFVSYMDVDLATKLDAFPKMMDALMQGYDVSVGSKYIKGAEYHRDLTRLILSKGFNLACGIFLGTHFTDAQLGFKSLTRNAAAKVLPKIKDNFWFFDTELLYYSEKMGMRMKEVPVEWKEGKKSGVKLFKTTTSFMKCLFNLKFRGD